MQWLKSYEVLSQIGSNFLYHFVNQITNEYVTLSHRFQVPQMWCSTLGSADNQLSALPSVLTTCQHWPQADSPCSLASKTIIQAYAGWWLIPQPTCCQLLDWFYRHAKMFRWWAEESDIPVTYVHECKRTSPENITKIL